VKEADGGFAPYRAAVSGPRRSGAFRDTLIVALLAVGGVVGLIVWDGGGDTTGGIDPGASPAATTSPATTGGSGASSTVQTQAVTPSAPNPSDPAVVAAQDALIGVLPAPAGGTEIAPAGAGVRTWTFSGADWQSIRDAYVGLLRQQTYRVELQGPATGARTGELYALTDPSGTISVALTVATQNGQSVIEVTRQ
jgi:hypothetical protein